MEVAPTYKLFALLTMYKGGECTGLDNPLTGHCYDYLSTCSANNKRQMSFYCYPTESQQFQLREGVKKNVFLVLCPKHRTPPTHRARLGLH